MLVWVCDNDDTVVEPGSVARCPTCSGTMRQVDDPTLDDATLADPSLPPATESEQYDPDDASAGFAAAGPAITETATVRDLGGGHSYVTVLDPSGVLVGIIEDHVKPDGTPCGGTVEFSRGWTVVSVDPLTLTPSIQCPRCPSHGFITEGRWVDA